MPRPVARPPPTIDPQATRGGGQLPSCPRVACATLWASRGGSFQVLDEQGLFFGCREMWQVFDGFSPAPLGKSVGKSWGALASPCGVGVSSGLLQKRAGRGRAAPTL